MNDKPIEYIEIVPGYKLNKNELGCEYFDNCFECKRKDCRTITQPQREYKKKYRETHRDQERERHRRWREKKKLAKMLDDKREEIKNGDDSEKTD